MVWVIKYNMSDQLKITEARLAELQRYGFLKFKCVECSHGVHYPGDVYHPRENQQDVVYRLLGNTK